MIISESYIRGCNFPIEDQVTDSKILGAIEEAELLWFKDMIGNANYVYLINLTTSPILDGGMTTDTDGNQVFVCGFKKALAYIVFAAMIRNNMVSTTFGTVQKKDDYSENRDPFTIGKYYYSIGVGFVYEMCKILGWTVNKTSNYYSE